MALTSEERAMYEQRLVEAETAMHQMAIGQSTRVYVDQNGERVEFNLNSIAQLRGYVMELRALLGKPLNVVGPMKAWMLR
jgi:hypothetical protein